MTTSYWCERAWLGADDFTAGVLVDVDGARIVRVAEAPDCPDGAVRLAGLTIPGFANCHSHAFHRALRGRTQREKGTFWTWRRQMYDVAVRLDPDSYYALAHAAYREMAHAGITSVGEFHYLHHDADGSRYADPNAMGRALIAAARDAGLRIALLDCCYLSSGFGAAPQGVQVRFSDGHADHWAERVSALRDAEADDVRVGAAIHSVRAVPAAQLATVAGAVPDRPLHVHVSEQRAENEACLAHTGLTPTELFADKGVLGPRTTAVHATHLTENDIDLLGRHACFADFCPTTERDLADGIGPSRKLVEAGADLTLGSDSHAVVDLLEEMRALELDERLGSEKRGHWRAPELIDVATVNGQRSLGFADAGTIEAGAWADLVTISDTSVRTAGTGSGPESIVFAATSADVTHVVASGRVVELDHADVGRALAHAISKVVTG